MFLVSQKINTSGTSNADVPLADPGMYQLDITLRRGQSLAARDRGGKILRTPLLESLFCVFLTKFVFLMVAYVKNIYVYYNIITCRRLGSAMWFEKLSDSSDLGGRGYDVRLKTLS